MILIEKFEDIPDLNNSFWEKVDNEEVKSVLLFLILREIRATNSRNLSDESLRESIGKLQAFQELVDFKLLKEITDAKEEVDSEREEEDKLLEDLDNY